MQICLILYCGTRPYSVVSLEHMILVYTDVREVFHTILIILLEAYDSGIIIQMVWYLMS